MIEFNGFIFGLFLWIAYSVVLLQLFSPRDPFTPQNLAYDHAGDTITVEYRVATVSDALYASDHPSVRGNRNLRSQIT